MRAGTQLALVLLGGGALAGGVAVSGESWRSCAYARLHDDPAADARCGGDSTRGIGTHFGWFSGSRGTPVGGFAASEEAESRSVMRGGFGLFGLHFGGFHG